MLQKLIYQQVVVGCGVFSHYGSRCLLKGYTQCPSSFDPLHTSFPFVCLHNLTSNVVVLLHRNSELWETKKSVVITLLLQAEIVTEF